ncbi:MAG: hypothetical protein WA949_23385 [Phormidesmis sp.]
MKKTDMELQAIREKLLSLQADSKGGEILSSPWAPPRSGGVSASNSSNALPAPGSRPAAKTEATPPAAITALQRRADSQPYGSARPISGSSASDSTAVNSAANDRADELVAQELFQLEMLASNINERSQQQADELLRLKRSAQQAAFHLRRQGIHTHPQLDVINQFLEQFSTASVPNIKRDTHGQFCLTHTAVNLNQAEAEASDNAELLRRQQAQPMTVPFSQPVANGPGVSEYLKPSHRYRAEAYQNESYQDEKQDSKKYRREHRGVSSYKRTAARLKRYISSRIRPAVERRAGPSKDQLIAGRSIAYVSEARSEWLGHRLSFSLTDVTIWFAGAVIVRILLNALVISHPSLQMPLLLVLVGAISYSIYRIVLAKSTDMSATYRIGAALLGLFLGSAL